MPQAIINIIVANISAAISVQSGSWADYNCLYLSLEQYRRLTELGPGTLDAIDQPTSNNGIMCEEDLPSFPIVANYSSLVAPPTYACGNPIPMQKDPCVTVLDSDGTSYKMS
jgi:hypothetical protein